MAYKRLQIRFRFNHVVESHRCIRLLDNKVSSFRCSRMFIFFHIYIDLLIDLFTFPAGKHFT